MITLITGLPGNGKTLYAIWYIEMKSKKEGRPVYYSGIKGLTLPWKEIDPKRWMDCPPESIIVIDECQFLFEKRPNGSKVPDYYAALATHRHLGVDIFLITQGPKLIDNFVRELCASHFHCVRKFGMQRSTIYEWSLCVIDCAKASAQRSAIVHKWAFPKEVFDWYKSAEVHTVKRTIPAKLVLAVLFVIAVLCVGLYALHRLKQKGMHEDSASSQAGTVRQGLISGGDSGVVKTSYRNADEDAKQFLFERRPRLTGLPQTAPRYDENTKPTVVPIPAACISNPKKCSCFTQQATPMSVPDLLCRDIVARGYFIDFDANGQQKKQMASGQSSQAQDAPVAPQETAEPLSSRVVTLGDEDGYGVLGKRSGGRVVASK